MAAEVFNLATAGLSVPAISYFFTSGRKVSCTLMEIHKATGKSQKYFWGDGGRDQWEWIKDQRQSRGKYGQNTLCKHIYENVIMHYLV